MYATPSIVDSKYRITRRIGAGSFGEIFIGIGPNEEQVSLNQTLFHSCQFLVTHRQVCWIRLRWNWNERMQNVHSLGMSTKYAKNLGTLLAFAL